MHLAELGAGDAWRVATRSLSRRGSQSEGCDHGRECKEADDEFGHSEAAFHEVGGNWSRGQRARIRSAPFSGGARRGTRDGTYGATPAATGDTVQHLGCKFSVRPDS